MRNSILKETSDHFSRVFELTTDEDFRLYKKLITPAAFAENGEFIRGKRILELGSGGLGHAISGFLSYGAKEVVGVEISPDNIRALRKRFGKDPRVIILQMDISHLPRDLGMFDIIYSHGVVHHTISPDKAVACAYRLLKKGGTFIVGLYGRGGVVTYGLHFFRFIRGIIPKRIVYNLLSSRFPHFVLLLVDYLYVPILKCYSETHAVALLKKAGFTSVVRIANRTIVKGWTKYLRASQMDYRDPLGRILHGNGWINLKARK